MSPNPTHPRTSTQMPTHTPGSGCWGCQEDIAAHWWVVCGSRALRNVQGGPCRDELWMEGHLPWESVETQED